MTIQTDLSVSPYFDDYSEQKDFYKILFRPGVAVQARELNQLQTILQKQIERFGNHVFKQGTIIDGCDITFHSTNLKYVKIRDVETSSLPVDTNKYIGYRVKNLNDITPLEAHVLSSTPGFESTSPDLNTLYVRYLNTGDKTGGPAGGQIEFNAGETLIVYSPDSPIEKITVDSGSTGFLPTDRVVILPAIEVQNTTGNFIIGQFITDGTANVQITSVDTTTLPNTTILGIRPRVEDLRASDFSKWTLSVGNNIQTIGIDPPITGTVASLIGSGASATLTTTALGEASVINIAQKGSGYTVLPHISIASPSASLAQISSFSATAQTELARITVAPSQFEAPVGTSYGMTVGEGVIYQKGYFSRVSEQLVIVDKYSNTPDDKSVGFETNEDIIDSNEDTSLLDNATGAPNFVAPGANRLKLTPVLKVISKAEADVRDDWLYIAEFSNGNPYKQNRQTVYNVIGKEINRRFNETAGSYVSNPFLLATKSSNTFANESTSFNIFIDPGVAFINGSRVETVDNYEEPVNKGTDTVRIENGNVSLNYGNFVRVNQVGGHFLFKTGDLVNLYDQAGTFITASVGSVPSSSGLGNLIGTARIRSLVFDSGIPGTASCVYRLYLFDIQMNFGKNFANVRSIFYNGTQKAVCDPVLESNNAVIKDNINSSLIYYAGSPAVVNASAISYIYRTSGEHTIGSPGTIVISVPAGGSNEFPYTGTLSSTQLRDLIVVPTANGESASDSTGTVSATTSSPDVTGVGTNFVSDYREGDYVRFVGANTVGQVAFIANDTFMTLTANCAAAVTANNHRIYYPSNAPINMERDGRSAVVSGDRTQITINIGTPVVIPVASAVTYNVRQNQVEPIAKVVNRGKYVRLNLANNATAEAGPWALGVSDVFRLKKVYRNNNSGFDLSEEDVTQFFYIDHNQNEDFYGISYLYQRPGNNLNLTSSDWLLVEFDHFTTNPGEEGLKGPGASGTYPINDGLTLAAATSTINTVEIPEVFGARGTYYDLRDHFDFRPLSTSTATPSSDHTTSPINPADQDPAVRFSVTDKKFPAPDSELSATINHYVGRTDRVVIDESTQFRVIAGTIGSSEPPPAPENALSVNILKIPPYPSLPFQLSTEMIEYIDTKIANERYNTRRLNQFRITTAQTDTERATNQPRGYTMADIGKLERRIAELEYYTSLTLTELQAQKRSLIGTDGTERFKFGFFVDGFEDYTFADIANPAYNATIVDGYLSPKFDEININMYNVLEDDGVLPYLEVPFISQTRATDGLILSDSLPVSAQIITSIIQSERNRNVSDLGVVFEEFFYTFSAKSGPVEFYINSRDNNIGVEVSQATSPNGPWNRIIRSGISAQPITTSDITAKGLRVLNGGRKIEHPGTLDTKSYPNSPAFGNFIEDQFKLLWSHNPDNGIYIRIRVYKGKKHGGIFGQGRTGTFGYKLFYPVDTTVNQSVTANTTNFTLDYKGLVVSGGSGFNPTYDDFDTFATRLF